MFSKSEEIEELEDEIPDKKLEEDQILQFLEVLDNKNIAIEFFFLYSSKYIETNSFNQYMS